MQQDKEGQEDYRFARGWFIVATSQELTREEPLRLVYFDRKMVAFRSPDGTAHVLDGICPHMAAEIGVDGIVDEGGVRCPYHHWRYGPDGRCNHIPYSDSIPPQAKVHSYPVREVNGAILIWNDPEFGEPDYEVPVIAELDDPQWVPWDLLRIDVPTTPREIVDNIADYGHFEPTHHCKPTRFDVTFDGHNAIQRASMTTELLADDPGGMMHVEAVYTGPGYFVTDVDSAYQSKVLLSNTPVDDHNVAVWFGQMVKSHGEITPEFMQIRDAYVENGKIACTQDVRIWSAKALATRPLLCRGDGPILSARKWYSQYLRPREKAEATVS
jgi:3-ketosteroid 9alpha-monooxygenase subunit A